MNPLKKIGLIAGAIVLPLMLAFAAATISRSFGIQLPAVPVPAQETRETPRPAVQPSPSPVATTTPLAGPSSSPGDVRGSDRCLEPEHRNDPTCTGSGSGSDSGSGDSGSGGSGGGHDGSGDDSSPSR